jgi:hypothetical protein
VNPKNLNYGHILGPADTKGRRPLWWPGVISTQTSWPAGAVFQAVTPRLALRLDGESPRVIGGQPTGAATTDGAIIISESLLLPLSPLLTPAASFYIEP